MKEIEVTFKLRVRSSTELNDVVIIMTTAANRFFNATHTDRYEHSTVVNHTCHNGLDAHPENITKKCREILERMKL